MNSTPGRSPRGRPRLSVMTGSPRRWLGGEAFVHFPQRNRLWANPFRHRGSGFNYLALACVLMIGIGLGTGAAALLRRTRVGSV